MHYTMVSWAQFWLKLVKHDDFTNTLYYLKIAHIALSDTDLYFLQHQTFTLKVWRKLSDLSSGLDIQPNAPISLGEFNKRKLKNREGY